MSNQSMIALSIALVLTGCGSDTADPADAGSGGQAAEMQPADLPASSSAQALVISPRTYASGSVRAKVTGFFDVDGTQEINKPASITDEDQTWIQYGVSGAQELNVLFTNSTAMAENGVNIGVGPYTVTATSTSGECRTRFEVSPATITGHYSCTGSTGYNNQTGQMGKVDIEVEFSAGS
jgi:hypothetical protein